MAEDGVGDKSDENAEPEGKEEAEPKETPAEAGGTTEDKPEDDLDPDESEQRETADTFNIVYNVAGDHFGDIGANRRRRRTGELSEEDARESVQGFVAPPGYGEAYGDLLERRLAVLAGAEGSGRRCAAISLLTELPGTLGPLVVLPPTKTVDELGSHPFRAGRRYLLPDLPGAAGDAALRRHDADMVLQQLTSTEAHLVVTTSRTAGRQMFGDLARQWPPVAASDLVAACLEEFPGVVDAEGEKRLLDVCDSLTPAGVRVLLGVVLDRGLDEALASKSAMGRRTVAQWFADGQEDRDVVRVALVAFMPFCDRRGYGRRLSRLRELIAQGRGDQPTGPEPLRQEHVELRAIPLVSTEREGEDASLEPLIRPASPDVHAALVAELFDLYGPDLLEPLRTLQGELALTGDGATQFGVAYGMAMLAQVSPVEVEQRLAEWAAGFAPERRTAAFTLAVMCTEDTTADAALRIAISWSSGAGERRAATAATAFGLTLADRFPVHAISHLWALALRPSAVNSYARQSLIALAQDLAEDTAALRDLLRTLGEQMRHLLDEKPRRPRRELRGTSAVAGVLTAPGPAGSPGSMSGVVLRQHVELVELLGALWADVLCSRWHRGEAVRALRGDLDSLQPDRDKPAVERLGAEIHRRLAPEQWDWLRRDLPGEGWLW